MSGPPRPPARAARGPEAGVYTRRDDSALPERVPPEPGVTVVHVPVGPAEHVPKDELLRFMPAFGRWLAADRARGAGARRPGKLSAGEGSRTPTPFGTGT